MQMEQNATARLLTGTRKQEHIPPILASDILAVDFRIHFKIILFAFSPSVASSFSNSLMSLPYSHPLSEVSWSAAPECV